MLEKLFPIYSIIRSHKNPGSTIIYINLIWLWMISSFMVGTYFSYQHISAKMAEYEHMKKNYTHYDNRIIELSIPEYIQPAVDRAKENPQDILGIYRYYHIRINHFQSQENDFFNKLLLRKAADSDNWFIKILANRNSRPSNTALLYNTEWLVVHEIDCDQLLKTKIGEHELYFTSYPIFINQKMYGSVTWNPSWLIYFLNTWTVLWRYAQIFTISGLFLILFFYSYKKLFKHYHGPKDCVVGLMLKYNRDHENKGGCIIFKGIENIILFPSRPNKPETEVSNEKT